MFKLETISPSKIKTYDTCLFKYYLTYCCPDIKLRSNWGGAIGTLIHDILENYSNNSDTDWLNRLYRGFGGKLEISDGDQKEILESPLIWAKDKDYKSKKPYCDSCFANIKNETCAISLESFHNLTGCPKDLFNQTYNVIANTIQRYIDIWPKILKNNNSVPIGTEYKYNIKIDDTDVCMNGIMDLIIEETPETIHIIDYKTGQRTQNYDECRNDIQVKMYSLAARKEFIDDIGNRGYNYKNVILTFDYFTKSPITLAFTKEEDIATERYVKQKIKQIQNTEWIYRIVPNNVNFNERNSNNGYKYFTCNALCDPVVCSTNWKGRFKT